MADIYVDHTDGDMIEVKVCRGASAPKVTLFMDVIEARNFAYSKLGKRSGMVLDTTHMTPDQLSAHKARQARIAGLIDKMAQPA